MHRIAMVVVALVAALTAGSSASAAPSGTSSCPASPSGYISWNTDAEPYQADNRVDLNGNGIACAKPTNKTFIEDGVTYPIYNFIDDVLR
jgi:hypothetical protein